MEYGSLILASFDALDTAHPLRNEAEDCDRRNEKHQVVESIPRVPVGHQNSVR